MHTPNGLFILTSLKTAVILILQLTVIVNVAPVQCSHQENVGEPVINFNFNSNGPEIMAETQSQSGSGVLYSSAAATGSSSAKTERTARINGIDGSFVQSMHSFYDELVRKRRQLPPVKDENKQGYTDEEKDGLLLLHNSYRSLVSPTATNMVEVTWDDDIEAFAQEWADVCGGDHRSNRDLNDWKNMGENLYWWSGKKYNLKNAVKYWFEERDNYDFTNHDCPSSEVCGHYITMAWAKSEKIGCGIRRCSDLGTNVQTTVYYFVCNYSGRFLSNLRPYEDGETCSNCPAEFPKCRYNLCVSESMFNSCKGYNGSLTWVDLERPSTKTDDQQDCSGAGGGSDDSSSTDPTATEKPATQGPTADPTTDGNGNGSDGGDDDDDDDDEGAGMALASSTTWTAILLVTSMAIVKGIGRH